MMGCSMEPCPRGTGSKALSLREESCSDPRYNKGRRILRGTFGLSQCELEVTVMPLDVLGLMRHTDVTMKFFDMMLFDLVDPRIRIMLLF